MTPALYIAGCTILVLALGISLYAILFTVIPARGKIVRALRGRGE